MSDLDTFGQFIVPTEVDDAAQNTLEKWIGTYLRLVERRIKKPKNWLPNPRSYIVSSDFDHFPEEQLPAVIIESQGTAGKPKMDGGRYYRTEFRVKVSVFVEASDRRSTERLTKYYITALRLLVIQKGSLGGFAIASCWEDESYSVQTNDRTQRTIGTATVTFNVEVREVGKRLSGPSEPIETEPGPIPTVKVAKAPTGKPEL